MDAEKFPITTPYGQVPGYELNNGWHRGEDRAMPMDTPVLVNGHEIGLSGNSGEVTGPHLHIGRFVGGHDTSPSGGGFHFGQAVVTEVSEDAVNGKFVRVQADGASWVYLHLSRQSVAVGQSLVVSAPPTPASYAITESYPEGRQIRLNKDTNLWGMNYHFDFMVAHPVETDHKQGEIWTVTNKVHHEDGYDYYRRDGQVDGFNVLDCDDYVAPPPPPIIPPAAPVTVPRAETYQLLTTLVYYGSALDCLHDQNALGVLEPRPAGYFVFSRDREMVNLTTDNVKDQNQWVNPKLNIVATPAPEPEIPVPVQPAATTAETITPESPLETTRPKPQYHWLNEATRLPLRYKSTNTLPIPVQDLEGIHKPLDFPKLWRGEFSMYADVNGVRYLIPDKLRQSGWMYGIPSDMLERVKPNLDLNHNGVADTTELAVSWDKFIDIIPRWVTTNSKVILPRVAQAVPKITKSIDGFTAKRKAK